MIGQIAIDLDEIAQDRESGGWYTLSSEHDYGAVHIRMLLCSEPYLYDKSNSWLLDDFDVVQGSLTAEKLGASVATSRNHPSDQEMLRCQLADQARLLWRVNQLSDKVFYIMDTDSGGTISP